MTGLGVVKFNGVGLGVVGLGVMSLAFESFASTYHHSAN
jgi:hypothetical protein